MCRFIKNNLKKKVYQKKKTIDDKTDLTPKFFIFFDVNSY